MIKSYAQFGTLSLTEKQHMIDALLDGNLVSDGCFGEHKVEDYKGVTFGGLYRILTTQELEMADLKAKLSDLKAEMETIH
jgi:hypothetical protein